MITKVFLAAAIAIVPLIAAAWLPASVPLLIRQFLLCTWGTGAILVAERLLFSGTTSAAVRAIGFRRPRISTVVATLLVSLPMWAFLPLFAWSGDVVVALRPDWAQVLLGVVLVNGITEEVIHRGFVFGHLRHERSFAAAATLSAMLFAAQHLYIIVTTGLVVGLSSVVLATLLTYPLAYVFERGGNSIGGPAILHTSSNAPILILALPEEFVVTAVLPHMGVVLVSLYLVFVVRQERS